MKGSGAGKGRGVTVGSVLLHLLPAILVCGVFAAVGIMHVTSRVMVVGVGYSLSKLESDNRDLVRENDRLKLELAMMKSPSRLEKLAREQLGMLPAPPGTIIPLDEAPKQVTKQLVVPASKPIVASKGRSSAAEQRAP
jgi:cell division protein FtsL